MGLYNYRCELCKNNVLSETTKMELVDEYKKSFEVKEVADDDISMVCDDCYDLINPKKNPFNVAKARMNASLNKPQDDE